MISVDDATFNAIEDFRFRNRFQTRSEATAELIRIGLEIVQKQLEESEGNALDKPLTFDSLPEGAVGDSRLKECP